MPTNTDKQRDAWKYLSHADKLLPLFAVMVGAVVTYKTLEADHESLRKDFEIHREGYHHDSWFSADGIRHPALREQLDKRFRDACEKMELDRKAAIDEFSKREEQNDLMRWHRFLDVNRSLVRPTGM